MKNLRGVLSLVFILATLIAAHQCSYAETIEGNLIAASLDESCDIELSYPSLKQGEKEFVNSISITAGGAPLSCSRFQKKQTWLYFTAHNDDGEYSGIFSIEKTGVAKIELSAPYDSPIEWSFSVSSPADESFYGLGPDSGQFNRRGIKASIDCKTSKTNNPEKNDNEITACIPFFSSDRGYGVWLDSFEVSNFDLASSGENWSVSVTEKTFRLYFLAGPMPQDVLMRFTSLAGRPPLWPEWAFAPWTVAGECSAEELQRIRDLDIPITSVVAEPAAEPIFDTASGSVEFATTVTTVPHATAPADLGFALVAPIGPTDDSENLLLSGARGFEAEFSPDEESSTNYSSYQFVQNIFESMRSANMEPLVISNTAAPGNQRYSISIITPDSGNQGGSLAAIIEAAQNAAMSGISVVGAQPAFSEGDVSLQFMQRYIQLASVLPVMFVPTDKETLDKLGDEYQITALVYGRLHNSLSPYIYSLAKEARDTGLPVIRPLQLAYPFDPGSQKQNYEFLVGNYLLVAPVIYPGQTSRNVYFPAGAVWHRFWGDNVYEGGKTITVEAPDEELPLFVREGGIIPMLHGSIDTMLSPELVTASGITTMDNRLVLRMWPAESRTNFRTAAGDTFMMQKTDNEVSIDIIAKNRRLWLNVTGTAPTSVTSSDIALEKKDCNEIIEGEKGWCYKKASNNTWIFVITEESPLKIVVTE